MDIEKTDNGVLFKVKVQPLARDDEIVGIQGDTLKIKINAPPLKGKANKALIDFLAKVVTLDEEIALLAADLSISHLLPLADAVVYATAMREKAQVVTSDSHFKDLDDVVFLPSH